MQKLGCPFKVVSEEKASIFFSLESHFGFGNLPDFVAASHKPNRAQDLCGVAVNFDGTIDRITHSSTPKFIHLSLHELISDLHEQILLPILEKLLMGPLYMSFCRLAVCCTPGLGNLGGICNCMEVPSRS